MISINTAWLGRSIALLAISSAIAGCGEPHEVVHGSQTQSRAPCDHADAIAPDITSGWDWPANEVAALVKRANGGDVEAAQRLWDYYSVHEDRPNSRYWQLWLFKRGDDEAMSFQGSELYYSAKKRPNNDPQKLIQLREAQRIVTLLESRQPDRRSSYELENIQQEIDDVKAGKDGPIQDDYDLDEQASSLFDEAQSFPDNAPEKLTKLRSALTLYQRMSRQVSHMDAMTLRCSNLAHLLYPNERAVPVKTLVEREIERLVKANGR